MVLTDALDIFSNSILLFSDSGDEMYLYLEGYIYAHDPDTGEQIRTQVFPNGVITRMEVPTGTSSIFILWCNMSGIDPDFKLIQLDRSTFAMIETLENSSNPTFIRYAESLSRLFLYPTEDNDISVVEIPGFQPAGEIDIDEYVKEMAISPSHDRLYCMVYYNSDLDVTE